MNSNNSVSRTALAVFLAFALCLGAVSALAAKDDNLPVTPRDNKGKKWRIGYIQGGDYNSYQQSLAAIVKGLMRLGWIQDAELPKPQNDKEVVTLWTWLSSEAKSDYVQFVADARYDAGFDKEKRPQIKKELLQRLNERKDIDLMLAMGTWAGQDMSGNGHKVPTIVGSTTDPIASGIIKSAEDSGYDQIHAKIDPDRHRLQVRLFHDIFKFAKLGIAYEESKEGRGFSAIDDVYQVAETRKFKVEKCLVPFNGVSQVDAEAGIVKCYRELADKVDAVYIVRHPGVNLANMPKILEPLVAKKIPTFTQGLSDEVKHGAMLSISLADFSYIGDFYAKTIARIFNGAKPRNLTQVFQNPPKIAINLKTAQMIGYDPSVDIVGAADEIFTDIAPPPQP
jgi:ABC-type uncharacterized transport system substrate-binding protein